MARADPNAPTYIVKLQPAPGSDDIRALRWVLKVLLRRFQIRCLSIEREDKTHERALK